MRRNAQHRRQTSAQPGGVQSRARTHHVQPGDAGKILRDDIAGVGDGDYDARKTDVYKRQVYVTVMEAEPTPGEGRAFETHSRYMDLQMDLEGAELCEVALGDVEEAEPYDEEKDFALWNGAASAALVDVYKRQGCYHV